MNETSYQSPPSSPSSPPPASTQGNGQAIASMVLGIVSFVLCGPICSVPAVILGHMTLGKIRRGVVSQDARGFAMAGTILGWINIALVALGVLFMALAMGLGFWSGGAGHVSPFVYQLSPSKEATPATAAATTTMEKSQITPPIAASDLSVVSPEGTANGNNGSIQPQEEELLPKDKPRPQGNASINGKPNDSPPLPEGALTLSPHSSVPEQTAADDILKMTMATYKAMETYKAEGTVVCTFETGAAEARIETSFTILLKKPNLYLISWLQKSNISPDIQSGAVWNDGTQPHFYLGTLNEYQTMATDAVALGVAAGSSGSATETIPLMFFELFSENYYVFARLTNPTLKGSELIGGEECYIIGGPSLISKEETLWISKSTYLMRKCSRSLEVPEAGRAIPEVTDEHIEAVLKTCGREVTEQSKKDYRRSFAAMAKKGMKGTTAEVHASISTPELNAAEFRYVLPEAAASGGKNMFRKPPDQTAPATQGDASFRVIPPQPKPGQAAGEIEGVTLDGKAWRLSDERGAPILLVFWSTWCAPCKAEIPLLKSLWQRYGESGRLRIVGLNVDKDMKRAAAFVESEKLPWPQRSISTWSNANADTLANYGLSGIPTHWLLDAEGNILEANISADTLKAVLERHLP